MKPFKEFPEFWLLGGVVPTLLAPDVIQARLLIREIQTEQPSSET